MKRKRVVKKPTIRFIHVVVVFVLMFSFGIAFQQFKMRHILLKEKKEVALEVERLEKEIEDLKEQVNKSSSLEFVERVAREEYGMIRPGEVIYVNVNREIGPYGKFFSFE